VYNTDGRLNAGWIGGNNNVKFHCWCVLYSLELGSPIIIPGYNKEIRKEFAWSKMISYCIFVIFFHHTLSGLFKLDRVPQMVEPSPHKFNCFIGEKVVIPSWPDGFFSPPLISSTKPPLLLTIFINHNWMIS
jgi:hypothetical protein